MYDVVVVGAGIIGSWTAYHLVKAGCSVLLLDQFALPHTRGSSWGHSRLIKRSHRRPHCSDLVPEAMEAWAELEKFSGTELVIHTGHLTVADKATTGPLVSKMKAHMDSIGERYDAYEGKDVGSAFPGMDFDDRFDAYFEDNGAVLKADKCLQALWNAFRSMGGTLRDEEKVLQVQPIEANLLKIETSKNYYRAKATVLTCGPWIKDMAKELGMKLPVEPRMVKTYHWKVRDTHDDRSITSKIPFMVYISDYHVYSTPDYEYPGMVKVCYHYRTPANPEARDATPSKTDQKLANKRFRILQNVVAEHLPYLEPEPAITERFLQSMSPDTDYILDCHPSHKNIVLGAGFSGHGFGVAPTIGRILANFVTNQPQGYDLKPFSLSRNFARSRL